MKRLSNTVMPYPWGSKTALASLRNSPPSETPEAELWMGAHPSAPSMIGGQGLDAHVADAPVAILGDVLASRFGRLPFLLKLLAAGDPLSLQAHPSKAQAEAGFAREEAKGPARDAATRNYKDDNHKPELICAISRFWALCGFRSPAASQALLRKLQLPVLAPLLEALGREDLSAAFGLLLNLPVGERAAWVRPFAAACEGRPEQEFVWAHRLATKYPDDPGAITSVLLNLVELQPLQALYLPAGNLHAYLEGFAVEIMASSDNVLRGGLTPKHVDPAELTHVLDLAPYPVEVLAPAVEADGFAHYRTPAPDFALRRFDGGMEGATVNGPAIVLAMYPVVLDNSSEQITLSPGESVFVGASDAAVRLHASPHPGTAFVATAGLRSIQAD